jgi:hypothetical protein
MFKFMFKKILLLILFMAAVPGYADQSLVPLNQEGVSFLNKAIKSETGYRISFRQESLWPASCNGKNNRVGSTLNPAKIRTFQFTVTPLCNQQIIEMSDSLLKTSIQMSPIQIFNSGELNYKPGEISAISFEELKTQPGKKSIPLKQIRASNKSNHALSSSSTKKNTTCGSLKSKNGLNQLLDIKSQVLQNSNLQSITDKNGVEQYFEITAANENVKKELARLFDKKKQSNLTHLETDTMSGIDEKMSLSLSGDHRENQTPCGPDHAHNDIANNLCNAMISNSVQQFLSEDLQANETTAHLVGTGIFAIKENLNPRYNPDDIAFVNMNLYSSKGDIIDQRVLGTVFMGGSAFIVWQGTVK